MKSQERQLAERIQKITGWDLVIVNYQAMSYVTMGLASNRLEALEAILKSVEEV